jgi:hypothetical protein
MTGFLVGLAAKVEVMVVATDPTQDHAGLSDAFASRRYFRKFGQITQHLTRVAAVMQADGRLSKADVEVITRYVAKLSFTFRALSMKYLLVGRDTGQFFGSLSMDTRESGFPVHRELLTMANDAAQAEKHLANMPSVEAYKEQMVRRIVGDQRSCNSRFHSGSIMKNSRMGICSGRRMIQNAYGLRILLTVVVSFCCIGRSMIAK